MTAKEKEKYAAFRHAYVAYGGWKALLESPYFWLSFVTFALLFPAWLPGLAPTLFADPPNVDWQSIAFSILPAFMGFSLASISVLLAFSAPRFKRFAHKERTPASYYFQLVATFFHFIVVQFFALIFSVAYASTELAWLGTVGFFMFIYSLWTALAAAAAIVGAARLLDFAERPKD